MNIAGVLRLRALSFVVRAALRKTVFAGLVGILPTCFFPSTNNRTSAIQPSNAFTTGVASQLLTQITQGLIARNQKQVLAAFDLSKMRDGALFRQQMVSFIAHAENIRIYFHVTQASGETANGQAEAEVQMEADPRDSNNTVPIRKQARLHFAAQSTPDGWKFTGVQPRNFFSLQP